MVTSFRGFAKKTLLKTARKAGFKQKDKRQKYVLPNMNANNSSKYMTSPGRMSLPPPDDYVDDDLSVDDFDAMPTSNVVTSAPTDAKTLERLIERSYVKDWHRMGLVPNGSSSGNLKQKTEQFRLTTVNTMYMMCRR